MDIPVYVADIIVVVLAIVLVVVLVTSVPQRLISIANESDCDRITLPNWSLACI